MSVSHWLYMKVSLRYVLSQIYEHLINIPLGHVYLHGPAINGFGFWEGLAFEDICAELTKVPARHWIHNTDECHGLIGRHQHAFVIGVLLVVMIFLFLHLLYFLFVRWFMISPILGYIERERSRLARRLSRTLSIG
jgi:hypothetical protein